MILNGIQLNSEIKKKEVMLKIPEIQIQSQKCFLDSPTAHEPFSLL